MKGAAAKNLRNSGQKLETIKPMRKEKIILSGIKILFTTRSLIVRGRPKSDSGKIANQGIREFAAMRKFVRRKMRAKSPAPTPTINWVVKDFMKISVNLTSLNHHQSVMKLIILEAKKKLKAKTVMTVQEKSLRILM